MYVWVNTLAKKWAHEKYKIKGDVPDLIVFVKDINNEPVEGAIVTVTDKHGRKETGTTPASGTINYVSNLHNRYKVVVRYGDRKKEARTDTQFDYCRKVVFKLKKERI